MTLLVILASKTSSAAPASNPTLLTALRSPAVGSIYRLTDASNVYVDLERTNGGEMIENWRWNVGFRTEF